MLPCNFMPESCLALRCSTKVVQGTASCRSRAVEPSLIYATNKGIVRVLPWEAPNLRKREAGTGPECHTVLSAH